MTDGKEPTDSGWKPTVLGTVDEEAIARATGRQEHAVLATGASTVLLLLVAVITGMFLDLPVVGGAAFGYALLTAALAIGLYMRSAASGMVLTLLAALDAGAPLFFTETLGIAAAAGIALVRIGFVALLIRGLWGIASLKRIQKTGRDISPDERSALILRFCRYSAAALLLAVGARFWWQEFSAALEEPGAALPRPEIRLSAPAADDGDGEGDLASETAKVVSEGQRKRDEREKRHAEDAEKDAAKAEEEASEEDEEAAGEETEDAAEEEVSPAYAAAEAALGTKPDDEAVLMAAEGGRIGEALNDRECVGKGLRRHDLCENERCHVLNGAFLLGCLSTGEATPDLCERVPSAGDEEAMQSWAAATCLEVGRPVASCQSFYRILQIHCEARAASSEEPAPEGGASDTDIR